MVDLLSKKHTILEKGYMAYPPFGVDPQGRLIRDVSGVTVRANVDYLDDVVEQRDGSGAGARAVEQLCALLNERIRDPALHVTPAFLRNVWNSYSYEFVMYLAEFCEILSGDPTFQQHVGRHKFISPLIQILARPFTLPQIYRMFPHFGEKFAKGSITFGVGEVTETSAVLRMQFSDHVYDQFGPWRRRCAENICQSSKSGLAAVPEKVHGIRAATIKDRACIAEGDDRCEWEFTWHPQATGTRVGLIGTIAGGSVGFLGTLLMPAGINGMFPWIATGVGAALGGLGLAFLSQHRRMAGRERLIREQLEAVEARHEELREAYLQQEQVTVELRRRINQLTILHRTGLVFNATLDREGLIRQVLQALVQDLHYDRAMMSFFDRDRQVSYNLRLYGVREHISNFARSIVVPVKDPESAEGVVLLQGRPLCIGDVRDVWDRLHPLHQQLAFMTKAKSVLSVPLKVKDRILGSLTVDRTDEQSLSEEDLSLMTTLGNQVAIALDNADAYHKIEDLNVGLEARVRERTSALEHLNTDLEGANVKLKEMDRLKSAFVSIVSHELRTPMTSIKGYVENMLDGLTGSLTERQQRYLERIRHNSERLTRMINELLDLSRIEAGQMHLHRRPAAAADLIEEVVEGLQNLAHAKGIDLTVAAPAGTPAIDGDHDKLHQVLTNLVHNAIKFTAKGGRVSIETLDQRNGCLQVTVADTGCGIPAAEIDKIFYKFYRGNEVAAEVRGAGLGLAISKTLVELHGGRIWVESQPGAGSRFMFTVPAVQVTPSRAGSETHEAAGR